jgi:repressor LexA
MKLGLTARQQELLSFIIGFFREHGYAPSFDEMAAGINSPSRGSTHGLVERLIERGYLKRLANRTRSIALVDDEAPATVPADVAARLKPYCQTYGKSLDDALRLAVSRFFGGAA